MMRYMSACFLVLFVASTLQAGVFFGTGIATSTLKGTYTEQEYSSRGRLLGTNQWDVDQSRTAVPIWIGYGHIDFWSVAAQLQIGEDSFIFGPTFKYGFELMQSGIHPYLSIGTEFRIDQPPKSNVNTSWNTGSKELPKSNFNPVPLRIGVGVAYPVSSFELNAGVVYVSPYSPYYGNLDGIYNRDGVHNLESRIEFNLGVNFHFMGVTWEEGALARKVRSDKRKVAREQKRKIDADKAATEAANEKLRQQKAATDAANEKLRQQTVDSFIN